jgi:hypothetical protein
MAMMRSKKKRQQKGLPEPEKAQEPGKPKKIGTVLIDVYEDMNVNVSQFPTDQHMAMLVLGNALLAVNQWFFEQKQKNASPIVMAKKPAVSQADIEKMKRNN